MTLCVDDNGDVLSNSIKGHNYSYTTFVVSGKFGRFQVPPGKVYHMSTTHTHTHTSVMYGY